MIIKIFIYPWKYLNSIVYKKINAKERNHMGGKLHFNIGMPNKTHKTSMKEHIEDIKYNKKTTSLPRQYNKIYRLNLKKVESENK